MQDKARQRTDKRLEEMEKRMSRVYRTDPALLAIKQKYDDYMDMVAKEVNSDYVAYQKETDMEHRQELKNAYKAKLEGLTIRSEAYNKIVDEFTTILAEVNQKSLDIANEQMLEIYVDNYNQVATECRKIGVKVNGKE